MRLLVPTLALLLLVTSSPPGADASDSAPYMERSERVAEARGLSGLEIDNPRGSVAVMPSADGRLHVIATKVVRMPSAEEVKRYAAEARVETAVRDGRYVVTVDYPKRLESHVDFWDLFSARGRRNLQLPSLEVRLELQVPATMAADVRTVSGDVTLRGLSAGSTIRTTSGDVEVSGVRGAASIETVSGEAALKDVASAQVKTTSGDVEVEGAASLTIRSTSGDVTVGGARDAIRIETVSGDVVVEDAPRGAWVRTASGEIALHAAGGKLDAATQSGDVHARLRAPLESALVASVSGDVTLEMVPGLGAHLVAHSTSGSIDCGVPAVVLDHGRNSLEARLGAGGAPVRTETTSGNVTITSGGK